MVQTRTWHEKNTVCIRLTESVVFLRTSDPTGRDRIQDDAPPGMVRGLLTLNIVKPTRISNIEIELQGKATTSSFEGVGARRIEVTEQHKVFSASTVLFQAGPLPSNRRTASVGPGLPGPDHDPDEVRFRREHSPVSNLQHPNVPPLHARSASVDPRYFSSATSGRFPGDNTPVQRDIQAPRHQDSIYLPTPPYSPPTNGFSFADHRPSPAHSRSGSISQTSSLPKLEESPAQTLEDLRRALMNNIEANQSSSGLHGPLHTPPTAGSSASSIHSYHDRSLSRRPSIEGISEDARFSPGQTSRFNSPTRSPPAGHRSGSVVSNATATHMHDDTHRGRKHARFSFSAVANAIDTMVEHVRSRSPRAESQRRSMSRHHDGDSERGRTLDRGKGKLPDLLLDENERHKHHSTLAKVGELLGLEEEHRAVGDGWKEFKKGTYTYPISFAMPNNSPPTIECDHGSMIWRLKAEVHRPGAFTTKLTAQREVLVVVAPGEEDTEESENIIIERQWESQLQYHIAISGRSFPTGGTIPLDLTIMPFTKAKVHRISVYIDERIDYHTQMKRIARSQPARRIPLLSLRDEVDGESRPLLPLISDDPHALRKSPLYQLLNTNQDEDEMASTVMGPGPWAFHHELQLPEHCSRIHFSNRNKKSNITINHTLKIALRVERGDDEEIDPRTKQRKQYDILIQTPVHILSCRCTPAWMSLPRYYEVLQRDFVNKRASCPCGVRPARRMHSDPEDSELQRLDRVVSSDSASRLWAGARSMSA
ncbi:hypothetical protein AZE42_05236 [Rhizopogon vesiculosus]|uniref:Arrestin C-terminal-like domain-containing protein n=1 Tax=Rhizopogon vesiculosus TaxID=180088 RepID=A0A1J8QDX3_9AGAM|nr:hypothetical protein AZE42_05236 [Rhizopogon vesiculosus]